MYLFNYDNYSIIIENRVIRTDCNSVAEVNYNQSTPKLAAGYAKNGRRDSLTSNRFPDRE